MEARIDGDSGGVDGGRKGGRGYLDCRFLFNWLEDSG